MSALERAKKMAASFDALSPANRRTKANYLGKAALDALTAEFGSERLGLRFFYSLAAHVFQADGALSVEEYNLFIDCTRYPVSYERFVRALEEAKLDEDELDRQVDALTPSCKEAVCNAVALFIGIDEQKDAKELALLAKLLA